MPTRKEKKQARRRSSLRQKKDKCNKFQDVHHVRPRSRHGSNRNNNLIIIDRNFHRAWHTLAENMTVEETIEFIRMVMTGGTSWTSKDLERLRQHIIENRRL